MTPCEVCKSVVPLDVSTPEQANSISRLLIAEDDPLFAQDLCERVRGLGYETVGVAGSGQEAVALARETMPDLVLMDIQLAGDMDGIQAASQIRRQQIPIVYVTGCSSDVILGRAVQTDPSGYLIKPYETRDLKIALKVALQKHRAERERQKLISRLQNVLASVKTLSGRLSICAYCKRIKDRSGAWPEMETYVMQNSHASFSHGMCPDCFGRVKAQLQALEQGTTGPESLVLG